MLISITAAAEMLIPDQNLKGQDSRVPCRSSIPSRLHLWVSGSLSEQKGSESYDDPGPDTTVNEPSGSVFPAVPCPAVTGSENGKTRKESHLQARMLGPRIQDKCQWRPVQARVLKTTLVSLGP